MRILMTILILTGLVARAQGQQLEANSTGGFLVNANGDNPVPGTPFSLYVPIGEPIAFQVGGAARQPIVLAMGQLATTSTIFPSLGGQAFDLEQSGAVIVGDGIGGSGALPAFLFQTSVNGVAPFIFPTSSSFLGQTLAVQAVVSDPTAPLGLNLTAAASFVGSDALSFGGNDVVREFTMPSGAYSFYGNSYTSVDVSSNGWIRFGGGTSVDSSAFPIQSFFTAGLVEGYGNGLGPVTIPGNIAPAPCVAALWADLDFSSPGSEVSIRESSSGVLTVDWVNAESATVPIGSFRCSIDTTFGSPLVVLDYSGVMSGAAFPGGLLGLPAGPVVGVTDGGTVGAAINSVDLASGGVLNAMNPLTSPDSFVQDFQGAGATAAEAFDLAGLVLNLLDQSPNSAGDFNLF